MDCFRRVCAEIDLDAIKRNIDMLMMCTKEGTKAMAVVKADAYGHGDLEVIRAIDEKIDAYAVATAHEAVRLKEAGVNKPVLVLGVVFPEEYGVLIEHGVAMTVFSTQAAEAMAYAAREKNKKAICHIAVDTGMRRIGLLPDENGFNTAISICNNEWIDCQGIFTHFATADEMDKTKANRQFEEFEGFVSRLKNSGVDFLYVHCSNSAAVIDMPWTDCDMVRLGISLYGLYPSQDVNKRRTMLFPALELKSHITMVKDIKKGDAVSYGATFVAPKDMRIATVPVGYGDGYPRTLSNKGYVLIHGKKAEICGRVCMDQFMVDVSHIPEAGLYDEVTLIGKDGEDCITADELAEMTDTISYEILCNLGKRIPRRFHLNGEVIATRDYFD
ncbi:MAG: alanine racemase [Lachnospiraceae bacterium]